MTKKLLLCLVALSEMGMTYVHAAPCTEASFLASQIIQRDAPDECGSCDSETDPEGCPPDDDDE